MSWGAVAGAAVGVVGGMMQSDAAGDAAAGQQQASRESNALQRYMYDNNVALQMPTINAGNTARDRLGFLLGLSPTGFSGNINGRAPLTRDQLRQELVGRYTNYGRQGGSVPFDENALSILDRAQYERIKGMGDQRQIADFQASHIANPLYTRNTQTANGPDQRLYTSEPDYINGIQNGSIVDEAALNAEIDRRLAEQDAQRRAAEEAARNDPLYGSLAQRFQFNTYTPEKFSYTGEDLYRDPSYQFRLQQGQKALDRQGAAAGRFLSGRQLQASSDYNQGAASQEFQNAYARALGTFNTNENNRFNAFSTNEGNRFNAHQANFANTVNPLLSLSGSGQVSAQFLGNAGTNYANQVGNNLQGAANASGAAGIAGANAIAGGLSSAYNGYQQNQLMNQLLNRNTGVNNNPVPFRGTDTLWGSGGFFSGNSGSGD